MTQYIDKAALVAEIERIEYETNYEPFTDKVLGKRRVCRGIKSFLDTLEVKKLDLEKELETLIEKEKAFVTDNRVVKYCNGDSFNHIYELEFIAKHFFELGLKAQKGE